MFFSCHTINHSAIYYLNKYKKQYLIAQSAPHFWKLRCEHHHPHAGHSMNFVFSGQECAFKCKYRHCWKRNHFELHTTSKLEKEVLLKTLWGYAICTYCKFSNLHFLIAVIANKPRTSRKNGFNQACHTVQYIVHFKEGWVTQKMHYTFSISLHLHFRNRKITLNGLLA